MKKTLAFLLLLCMSFLATGCSLIDNLPFFSEPTEEIFQVEGYNLQITADSSYHTRKGSNFDLQITDDNIYISIMAYKYIDLPEGMTPLDVYNTQNEDMFSRRTNVQTVEETKNQALAENNMTYAVYSAEKDGVKNYYATYLIDFPDSATFAWVLITSVPSHFENHKEALHSIVTSLTITKKGDRKA